MPAVPEVGILSEPEAAKLMRRIDLRVLPMLFVVYVAAFFDRANMNNIHGVSNWRRIFILEVILTILIGVAAYFFVSDFPSEAQWLSETERRFVLARTHETTSGEVTWSDMLEFSKDPKNYLAAITYFVMPC